MQPLWDMIRMQTETGIMSFYVVFFMNNLVVTKKQRIFAVHV